jgi:ribosome recycling factor
MQGQTKVFKYSNATVRVHIPDLAPEEREKRLKEIKLSAEMLLREVIRNEYNARNTNSN